MSVRHNWINQPPISDTGIDKIICVIRFAAVWLNSLLSIFRIKDYVKIPVSVCLGDNCVMDYFLVIFRRLAKVNTVWSEVKNKTGIVNLTNLI